MYIYIAYTNICDFFFNVTEFSKTFEILISRLDLECCFVTVNVNQQCESAQCLARIQ